MNCNDLLIKIYSEIPDLQELFNTRVRHYTIKDHTLNVCNQFERYFTNLLDENYLEMFRLLLVLHDIGKPIAQKKGNRADQYKETAIVINKYKNVLLTSENEFSLMISLLSEDAIGNYIQGKITLDEAYNKIKFQHRNTEISLISYFYLLSVYYQCDVASYTKDAGGLPYLEYLFEYQNGSKIFNDDLKLIQMSSKYSQRFMLLKSKIENIQMEVVKEENLGIPGNLQFISGNIFNSKAQTIVNTVNCVGVMGKGIALVFKLRYPMMFENYKRFCDEKLIGIGKLWLYNNQLNAPWVLNFPTKYHWKFPSKFEYIEKGLQKFVETYKEKKITSIAFPLLGTHNGGLDREQVKKIMIMYLSKCDIPIEVYDYDPFAPDDLFANFKQNWIRLNPKQIKEATGIQPQYIRKIFEVLDNPSVFSMVTLVSYEGIGEKTLQKAFDFAMNYKQGSLF